MNSLTASKFRLFRACRFPFLPTSTWDADTPNDAQLKGSAFGDEVKAVLARPSEFAADEFAEYTLMGQWARWFQQERANLASMFLPEMAFGICPTEKRAMTLGYDIGRDYAKAGMPAGWIGGAADLVGVTHAGRIVIYDWKTGRQESREDIFDHSQLQLLAHAARLALAASHAVKDFSAVDIVAVYITPDGVFPHRSTKTAFQLDVTYMELEQGYREVIEGSAAANVGAHCRDAYCPAMGTCPAVQAIGRETSIVAGSTPAKYPLVAHVAAIESKEHAAYLYPRLRLMAEWIERARKAVTEYVVVHGAVPLEDGRVLAEGIERRDKIVLSEDAKTKLVELLGFEILAEIKESLTKEAIKDATKLRASGRERTALERRVLEELANLGALVQTSFTTVEPRKSDKGEPR